MREQAPCVEWGRRYREGATDDVTSWNDSPVPAAKNGVRKYLSRKEHNGVGKYITADGGTACMRRQSLLAKASAA